jgi:LruC domain-containing protein
MNQHRAPMGLWALAAAACLCTLINVTSCGGGSSPAGTPQQGTGALPGQQQGSIVEGGTGTGNGGTGNGNTAGQPGTAGWGAGMYIPTPPQGTAGGDAPLGTVPEYNVTDDISTTTHEGSKTGSLVGGEVDLTFEIVDVTMTTDGGTPNWSAPNATFPEGSPVDIYMKYEIDPNFPLNRTWTSDEIGLEYVEPNVPHASAGTYTAKLDFTIPFGTTDPTCEMVVGCTHGTDSDTSDPFPYSITSAGTTTQHLYPQVPNYVRNDSQGGGCKPSFVSATFNGTSIIAESQKDLSNVVLQFEDGKHQKFEGLGSVKVKTFSGTGQNANKNIVGVWIKSGCNTSGAGPGYGEYLANPQTSNPNFNVALAQMAFEDLLTGSDYDYNDFVGRINSIETRNSVGKLVQIQFTLKAVARSAGYDSDWQFNINGAFPGATATATVNQYYTNGTRHGNQKIWRSSNGASIPVFTPIRSALPSPPGSYATNGIAGTQYMDGDYAEVTVVFDHPISQGAYTPAPYSPELRVEAGNGNVYNIGLWKQKGDPVDSTGRPLAFIIPDTYAWPLEGNNITTVFSGFNAWKLWINNQGAQPATNWWEQETPNGNYFRRDLFN